MEMENVFKYSKVESIYDGRRYGLGETAIFKCTNHVDKHVYGYARFINNEIYIAGPDYIFKKFDEDRPVYIYGVNTKVNAPKITEVTFRIDKVHTKDEGISFIVEYTVLY